MRRALAAVAGILPLLRRGVEGNRFHAWGAWETLALLRSAGRNAEAVEVGARLKEIKTKYDLHF